MHTRVEGYFFRFRFFFDTGRLMLRRVLLLIHTLAFITYVLHNTLPAIGQLQCVLQR